MLSVQTGARIEKECVHFQDLNLKMEIYRDWFACSVELCMSIKYKEAK